MQACSSRRKCVRRTQMGRGCNSLRGKRLWTCRSRRQACRLGMERSVPAPSGTRKSLRRKGMGRGCNSLVLEDLVDRGGLISA
jgi:hypothetical protein